MSPLYVRRAASLSLLMILLVVGAVGVAIILPENGTPESAPALASDISTENADQTCDVEELEIGAEGNRCKPCKDRPWCECTLNGMTRISCNPCCYRSLSGTVCLD